MGIPAPVDWQLALQYIEVGTVEELAKLGRSAEALAVYRKFRSETLQEYQSMSDYMKHVVYRCATSPNADGKKEATGPVPAEFQGKPIWRENDFPYWFTGHVEHHNIWCTQRLDKEHIEAVIDANREGYETVYFVNPEALQSIPELWHVHVLSRPKTRAS